MRKIGMTVAAAALTIGTFAMTPLAQAAQVVPTPPRPAVTTLPSAPVQMMDCAGTTGMMGCGPGWIWHDGWRGFACYPC
ncbi:hypothetical protein [Mycolicibacterium hodleri]|uniref:Uncharacterized protein n=1 Tax=Mycolicibacterium hodleri TaxID=49897 RepID=A0A502DVS1_9MYCO|nr:hypothetical protein [Mycolicibacterium hodleri]TPG28316.1 hypothetical protein EAH80_27640 [Mycolicibacterium hodleri]